MKQFIGAMLALGFFVCRASAKDCTWSNEFQVARSQVLAGVLEDPIPLPLPGFRLELTGAGVIKATAVTNKSGEYSFGEVQPRRYRIHIRSSGDPFCAPRAECKETGCFIQHTVKLNPKNETVLVQ